MPTFVRKNDCYLVSYITGPAHVLLGLVLGTVAGTPKVVRNSRVEHCDHGTLDERRIHDAVVSGIEESGVHLSPAEIHYYEGDSPRYELYKRCAYVLARHIAAGGEFPEMKGDAA